MDIQSIPDPPEDVDALLHFMTMTTEIGAMSGIGVWICVSGGTLSGKIITSAEFQEIYFDRVTISKIDTETGEVTTKQFKEYLKSTPKESEDLPAKQSEDEEKPTRYLHLGEVVLFPGRERVEAPIARVKLKDVAAWGYGQMTIS